MPPEEEILKHALLLTNSLIALLLIALGILFYAVFRHPPL